MKYKISDVSEINKNSIKKDYVGNVKYIDTSSVSNNIFNSPQLYESLSNAPSRAKRIVKKGDTVISTVRPNMHHIGFIENENSNIFSTGFAVLSPNTKLVDPFYLYLVLSSHTTTELLQNIGETSTSTYPSVKPIDIGNIEFDFPEIVEQKRVSNIILDIEHKMHLNNEINANLVA